MAKLNYYEKIPEYNADEYLKKFIPLVIKNAPEFDNFSVFDLHNSLSLSDNDKLIFQDLTFKIRKHFVENDIAKLYGSSRITLTDKGRDIKNGTEKIFGTTINNDFSNSTISQFNQESNFSNSPTTINPTATQEKKSFIVKFWKLITENKLVSGILLVIITEEITIGKIYKFIMDLF